VRYAISPAVANKDTSNFLLKTSSDGDSTVFPSKLFNISEAHVLVSLLIVLHLVFATAV